MAGDWIARLQIQEILAGGGSGTVTSVGLTMPTGFSVAGSPVTTSGTLAVTTSLNGHISGNGSGLTASATIPTSDLSGALLAANFPILTGDVTTPGASLATTIAADAVTNAKLANMATARFKGRVTAGTGDPEDLTGTQATTLLDVFTSALKGLVPASGGGTTNFLRADGTFAAPTASVAFTNVEVSLGSLPRRSGKFTISGAGMTIGKPVYIQQAVGPYTSKGTQADEAEMDQITLAASVTSAVLITVYWSSPTKVARNFKFNYLIGA